MALYAEDYLAPQVVTVDKTAIVYPEASHPDEAVWVQAYAADTANDALIVKDEDDSTGLPLGGFEAPGIPVGPFRINSPTKPTAVRIGTNTSITIVVVRSG